MIGGSQELVYISCPLCGSDRQRVYCKDSEMTYRRCRECGIVFLNPRPPYQEFAGDCEVKGAPVETPAAFSEWSLPRIKGFIKGAAMIARNRNDGRLLDIGCGDGRFLDIMSEYDGFMLYGLEPNREAARGASTVLGLEIFPGTLLESGMEDDFFDVVVMWDVLEHVYDPLRELQEIRRILKPNGLLLLRVPNLKYVRLKQVLAGKYLSSRHMTVYNPLHHLTYMNISTARRLLSKAGFGIMSIAPSRSDYGLSNLRMLLKTAYHSIALVIYALSRGRLVLSIDLLILAEPV